MYSSNIIAQLLSYYEQRRRERSLEEFEYEQKLLEIPNYSDAKYRLKSILFDLALAEFNADKEKIISLTKEKDILLKKIESITANIPALIPTKAECSICNDNGVVNGVRCHCFYKRLTDIYYDTLSIKKPILTTFDSDTLSSKFNRATLFEKMHRYCDSFSDNSVNLLFTGEVGTGKSFLAEAITDKISQKDLTTLFLTSFDFDKIALKIHTSKEATKEELIDILISCDFLCIDDLGTEPIYDNVTREYLLLIFSERIRNKKPFLITTNISLNNFSERYGERLFSRITGKTTVKIPFYGEDLRLIKADKKTP